jgi:hypothetical protein
MLAGDQSARIPAWLIWSLVNSAVGRESSPSVATVRAFSPDANTCKLDIGVKNINVAILDQSVIGQ